MANGTSAGERYLAVPWTALAMLPGVIALAAGAVLDVAYHVGATVGLIAVLAGDDGESAHLLLFAGMALVVAGLVAIGVRDTRLARRRAAKPARPDRLGSETSGSVQRGSLHQRGSEQLDREHSVLGG